MDCSAQVTIRCGKDTGGYTFFQDNSVAIDGTYRMGLGSSRRRHTMQPEGIAQQIKEIVLKPLDGNIIGLTV